MNSKDTIDRLADDAKKVADGVSGATKDVIESTRKSAKAASDTVEELANSAMDKGEPVVRDMAARAQDAAIRSIDFCSECGVRAQKQIADAREATTQYVKDQPLKSLAIAAASGAVLASIFLWADRKNRN